MKVGLQSAIVLLSLCSLGSVLGQTPPSRTQSEEVSIKGGAEEVMLDVVVRDNKGKLVKGLNASDFTVLDNGERRSIRSFRRIEGAEAVSSSGTRSQLDPLRQLRLITLVFQGGDANAKKLARDAAMELLKGELAQNMFMSVMAIDHSLQAVQPFTNDRDALKRSISRATSLGTDFSADTLRIRRQLAVQLGQPEAAGDASVASENRPILSDLNTGGPPVGIPTTGPAAATVGPAAAAALLEVLLYNVLLDAQADVQTDVSRGSVYPLLDLVKEQYRLPGRKTIIYFSPGFPVKQGTEDAFKAIISTANRANVSFYCVDINGLTTSSTNQQVLNAFRRAAAADALNVGGSGSPITTAQAEATDSVHDAGNQDPQNTIAMLAEQTGGALIANTNDFRAPIRKAVEDAESYYEITYDPQISKYDGLFRRVAVKTDLKDVRVQTRAGYFALPPHLAPGQVLANYEVPLLQALEEKPLPQNFTFQAAAMHFRSPNGPICEVVVDIPVSSLRLVENKESGSFDGKVAFVVLIKDDRGRVVKKLREEMPMRIDANSLAAFQASSHFIHNEWFALPVGRYTLEGASIDLQNQKTSARRTSFAIPTEDGKLGISSVTVIRNIVANRESTNADNPMLMEDKIITPMVSETLRKKDYDNIPIYLTIYTDRQNPEKPTLRIESIKDGTALGVSSPPIGEARADGRIQYLAETLLKDLTPGSYQLRFVVRQGTEEAAETVSFTIE